MTTFNASIAGQNELIERINAINSNIESSVSSTMLRMSILLQREVKKKLSNDVLKVQSGNLRSSIHAEVEKSHGKIMAVVGTKVNYAATHEYGLTVNHIRYKKRSFLNSALEEQKEKMIEELKKSVIISIQRSMIL